MSDLQADAQPGLTQLTGRCWSPTEVLQESDAHFRPLLERRLSLEEIAALLQDSTHAGAVPSPRRTTTPTWPDRAAG